MPSIILPRRGLHASILTGTFISSASVIAPGVESVTIVGPVMVMAVRHKGQAGTPATANIAGISEWDREHPPVRIFWRNIGAGERPYLHAEPVIDTDDPARAQFMMGGRFIYSCDSRFHELNDYPIPLHDHCEGNITLNPSDPSRIQQFTIKEYRALIGHF